MKTMNLLISMFAILSVSNLKAQNCNELFISEYVEGWSNNKAIEIFNPTNNTIDLSDYIIARYSNGSNTANVSNAVQLSGTILAKSTYVGVLDKRDQNGTGQEAPVWDSLVARANGFYSPVYNTNNTFYWNGNDAVVLFKGKLGSASASTALTAISPALVPVDIFGKIGEGAGFASISGWSNTAPYNLGVGTILTVDHSLIRKSSVTKGTTNFAIANFNALLEYDTIPAVTIQLDQNGDTIKGSSGNPILFGNWFSLGTHACDCNTLSTNEITNVKSLKIFPSISETGIYFYNNESSATEIKVYNSIGHLLISENIAQNGALDLSQFSDGIFYVSIEIEGKKITQKIIKY